VILHQISPSPKADSCLKLGPADRLGVQQQQRLFGGDRRGSHRHREMAVGRRFEVFPAEAHQPIDHAGHPVELQQRIDRVGHRPAGTAADNRPFGGRLATGRRCPVDRRPLRRVQAAVDHFKLGGIAGNDAVALANNYQCAVLKPQAPAINLDQAPGDVGRGIGVDDKFKREA